MPDSCHRPAKGPSRRHAGPPWQQQRPGEWNPHGAEWQRKRRFLLSRLLIVFTLFTGLLFGGMALISLLLSNIFAADVAGGPNLAGSARLIWLSGCGLLILIPLFVFGLGARAYRRYATPLADVMAAADAVADGDLSVRVAERGPGEFARLSRSFNRMTAELERSDRARRNLTADVAHELRNPLHIIQGNLEGVIDGVYAPSVEHIAATLEETRALTRLIEDLQTIAAAEAGQLALITEAVDVADLLDDVATAFEPQAGAAGVELTATAIGERSALTLQGDRGRLHQALANLVTNALRHTPAGGAIDLQAELLDDITLRITVSDSGAGIAPDALPYIFDRFWRGDPARSHQSGAGSGLGLAIVRQLVEAHGGRIAVESREEAGTQFVIDLPRERT